jgi:predicted RNase H-like nuclease
VLSLADQQRAVAAAPLIRAWLTRKEGACPIVPPGFSIQAVLIAERIVDTVDWVSAGGLPADVTVEAHPEVSFAFMNGGRPVRESKKTIPGKQVRQQLLADHGMVTARGGATVADFREVLAIEDGVRPAGDDILDAVAVAWTAWRIHTGSAVWSGPDSVPDFERPPLTRRQVIWH